MRKLLLSIIFTAFTGLLSASSASANATYIYAGNAFGSNSGSLSCPSCSITVTITFATPLGDNLSLSDVTPLSFSISDGISADTINQGGFFAPVSVFEFSTDAAGDITGWFVSAADAADIFALQTINVPGQIVEDQFTNGIQGENALVVDDPGTWTLQTSTAPTPEPASLLLLGTGLLGLGPVIRKRLTRS